MAVYRNKPPTREEFNRELFAQVTVHRAQQILAIEDFVRARTDQHTLSMPSLHHLSSRDLEWLDAAIKNTGK